VNEGRDWAKGCRNPFAPYPAAERAPPPTIKPKQLQESHKADSEFKMALSSLLSLAKRSSVDPRVVERFQVLIAGSELAKGFTELNDPLDQQMRFEDQQALREAGDDEAQRLDTDYVRAMEYGMPPAFGFGLSERVFAFFENKPANITQLFPLLRPKE
jgi:lysyl-tRNA synthetase class II